MTSIRSRLAIGLTLVLALLLVGQWLWLTLTIDRLIEKQVISRLQEETESLLANLTVATDGQLMLDSQRLSSNYRRTFSGLYYTVESENQQLFSRSLWDSNLDTDDVAVGQRRVHYQTGPQDQPLLAVSATYQKQDKLLTITVAEDIAWMLEDKRHFQFVFTLLSATGFVLLLLFQAGLIRQALQPLSKARRQLEKLGQGEIERIDENAPDEIRPLLVELNRLMQSMVVKTRRSRQALGNLAHRLKTQLTLINQIAESAPSVEAALRADIYQQTGEVRQIIDRELKRARIAGVTLPGKGVDLAELVSQLIETLQRIYRDKALNINWQLAEKVRFDGDREDLLELLGNLLDNACKWCHQAVALNISMVDDRLCLVVEDDGPGCDDDILSSLSQRGFRADESKPGSGLGLAIVQDIVESYSGSLSFQRSEQWGGLQVTVHLQT
ncbi:ATP-binding protein [Methylophaga sp. OBS1]|uniref:ATP-binding protein n=1 Tax=Methylophaga sp. OBS1 TaxID=2991933 RepID=UPI00224EA340|nr:ATP-binding protein [Methylophaga sp. OBS1]MCX4192749.1 ATP-binding protein [Methylophaga sp. OBS1]